MTVLGEAFIEVHGDLKPFIRDLDKELKKVSDAFEKHIKKSLDASFKDTDLIGSRTGDSLGDSIGRGMQRRLGDKKKPPYTQITAALASALDDGISALPAEAKAAIVTGIIAALPIISGALAGAISAAIGTGLAGVGTLLAFQFEEVRERGQSLASDLRLLFVNAASAFVPAVIRGIDLLQFRLEELGPLLTRVFTAAADYVEPIVRGITDFLDGFLSKLEGGLLNTGGFVEEMSRGLRTLGLALGEVVQILANTGESGRAAFRDLIYFIGILLINTAQMIAFFTEVYYVLRTVAEVLAIINPILAGFIEGSDQAAEKGSAFAFTNVEVANTMGGVIAATEEETKRMEELKDAIDEASDATYGIIEASVDYERSLDKINETLDENGKTLDITKEKGRENVEAFLAGLKAAEEQTLQQVANGKLSAEQAAGFYDLQIDKIRALALEAGITDQQFDILFGDIISVAQLKLDASAMGITNTEEELSDATRRAKELLAELERIRRFKLPKQGTRGFSEYAEGGLVTHPTAALIGEAGPEVVIPLTKPARAAQLMQQSGLAQMLAGSGTVVQVFVGNEELDARTVRIVERNNQALSSSLAFGARGL